MRRRPHPDPTPDPDLSPRPHVAALVALLAVEVLALLVLVHLGRVAPFAIPWRVDAWAHATPEDALCAALRWVALATAGWLFVVTVAYACVAGRFPPGARDRSTVRWSTRCVPALIRRIVDGALVASVAAAVVAGPATASAGTRDRPPVVTIVRDGRAGDLRSLPTGTSAPVDTALSTSTTAPLVVPETPVRASAPTLPATPLADVTKPVGEVVVAPGDNLWEIAARALARARGVTRASITDAEVVPYWDAVCDLNRGRLRSGDVNLVFPGEVVELPPAS